MAQTPPYSGIRSASFTTVSTGTAIRLTGSAIVYHKLNWSVSGTVSSCSVQLDTSSDNVTWTSAGAVASQTCTSGGTSGLSTAVSVNYVRVNVTALAGGGTVNVTWAGYITSAYGTTNVLDAASFAGANAGAKLVACLAALPSTGGTCDARGLTGAQTIATDIFSSVTKSVKILWGAANYSVSVTQTFNSIGLVFEGVGFSSVGSTGGTIFTWAGNATDPMFDLQDLAQAVFNNFKVVAEVSTPVAEVFRIQNKTGGTTAPRLNHFSDIFIEGTNGGVGIGFRGYVGTGASDTDNDFNYFENIRISNYSDGAWSIEGTQEHGWQMVNCRVYTGGYGGDYAVGGPSAAKSNVSWIGGFVGGHETADFYLATPADGSSTTVLQNISSEGSARFLETTGVSGARLPVIMDGIRYAGESLNADGYALYLQTPGPFTIRNSGFGSYGAGTYAHATKMFWTYSASRHPPSLVLDNVILYGTATDAATIFGTGASGTLPTNALNLVVRTGATTYTTVYENLVPAKLSTISNCADSAGDAACGAASAGAFVIDAADTNTVVSTTAVTANSQIFLQVDASLGTRLSVTCNTQDAGTFDIRVTARTAATSFTVTADAGPTTNPLCVNYFIVN